MNGKSRLRNLGFGLAIAVGAIPLTLFAALLLIPVWRWLELNTGIESIGHSGPAGWCYLTVYAIYIILGGLVWDKRRRLAKGADTSRGESS